MSKIVIIDSGVNINNEIIDTNLVKGVVVEGLYDPYKDYIGHGTAVAYIFQKNLKNMEINIINIYGENEFTTEENLNKSLEFIICNMKDVQLIHISSGIVTLFNKKKMEDLCIKLKKMGVIIVAANDNFGSISYPAAFDSVIGVGYSSECMKCNEYIYQRGSKINVLSYGGSQYVFWKNNEYKLVSGSSFCSPYVSIKILSIISRGIKNIDEINILLEEEALYSIKYSKANKITNDISFVKKALVFPENKEIKVLLENRDLLNFSIEGLFDLPIYYQKNKEKIKNAYGKLNYYSIENIEDIEDIDTLIIGHVELLNKFVKTDLIEYFLDFCFIHKKNLYFFDDISNHIKKVQRNRENGLMVISANSYYRDAKISDVNNGSLFIAGLPVVGICGTSSKQGKFTLQLGLRRELKKRGYQIAQFGTEPSSLLFGFDFMYPMGYGVELSGNVYKDLIYCNSFIDELSEDKELIIFGTQSHSIPLSFNNLKSFTFAQELLIYAFQPDLIYLVINADDDISYVNRTIEYFEKIMMTNVKAIILYPFKKTEFWNLNKNEKKLGKEEVFLRKEYYEEKTGKKVFINGDYINITNHLINYFGGDENE